METSRYLLKVRVPRIPLFLLTVHPPPPQIRLAAEAALLYVMVDGGDVCCIILLGFTTRAVLNVRVITLFNLCSKVRSNVDNSKAL